MTVHPDSEDGGEDSPAELLKEEGRSGLLECLCVWLWKGDRRLVLLHLLTAPVPTGGRDSKLQGHSAQSKAGKPP